jgi:translation elongation factor EF-1beta
MPKKVYITVSLVPEAAKVPNENLKREIEKELRKNIFVIPWANQLESIEIK